MLARGGSLRDLLPLDLATRVGGAIEHLVLGPGILRDRAGAGRGSDGARRWLPLVRGLLLAAPVVLLLGALLSSADAVFASFFDVAPRADRVFIHVLGLTLAGWWALGLLRTASSSDPGPPGAPVRWLGRTEVTVVLGAVVLLFGAFVGTQLMAATGGADHVLETAGLTRADYARSGFFQLLWVAGLVVIGLVVVAHGHDLEARGGRRIRRLCATVVGLAIGIVAVAVVRLDLYRDAYGWTMLRFTSTAFALWLGVVLALLGVALAGPASVRRLGWFVPAALGSGLAVLLALNVVNPEAQVARDNLTREHTLVGFDVDYVVSLSDDAGSTIVSLLPELPPHVADELRRRIGCRTADDLDPGWPSWNLGDQRARRARAELCRA